MASLTRRGPLLLALAAAAVMGSAPAHGLEFGLRGTEKEEEAERAEMMPAGEVLDGEAGPIPTTPCLTVPSADE